MTKEELSQIYFLNKEISMWQKELDKLECQSLIKSQEITGLPYRQGISDKTAELGTEKAYIRQIIEGKLAEIKIQRAKIIAYINSIEDSYMRQIIYYRYVSCMSWRGVAAELGAGYTSDSVRMAMQRFFKK